MFSRVSKSSGYLDLIFRGRNKRYGAYVLRSEYPRTLLRSLFCVMTGTILLTAAVRFGSAVIREIPATPDQLTDSIYSVMMNNEPLPDKKPEQKKTAPAQGHPASGETSLVRIADSTSVQATETPTSTGTGSPTPGAGQGTGTASIESSVNTGSGTLHPDSIVEAHMLATQPEFEGGINALRRFIAGEVVYPADMRESGEEGIVVVGFIVNVDGSISDLHVRRSAGTSFDREALRVVALLPKFSKPGMVNGQPVRVRFALPIRFRLGH